ncbi:MAG: cytochrome c [Nitrospinota bacterium]|nr:cytochrome c [Nitrospinota bacterium]
MNKIVIFSVVATIAVAAVFLLAPIPTKSPRGTAAVAGPSVALAKGRTLFLQNCMQCHGKGAQGSDKGPPLVRRYYEPNHHGDIAFYLAVERGVGQHHWRFGDMKPLPKVKREDVAQIIGYIRSLQRKAGVF